MRATWPLVGRSEILDQARQELRGADLAGLVLVGPAGVGKTRLAVEIGELAGKLGFHVERATASHSAQGIPFGALAPILPPAALAVERGIAMLGQAVEALAQRSGGRPVALVVDDAQWLDDASALLLHQLVVIHAVVAVATVRTGEPTPGAVQSLWKDGGCERVAFAPLTRPETEQLLEQVLGGQVEGQLHQELWEASEGNTQYLRELVLSGLDAGTLVDDAGLWRLVGSISPNQRLHDLVGERLAGLGDDELTVLELLAFGEPLGVDVVASLVGSDALVRVERKGLVETALDGRRFEATLAHPVHGEVVRERTPLTRAREIQNWLSDAIESHGNRRRADVLKVAIWRVEAGGSTSPEVLVEAARQAGFAHDLETALRLAGAAHEIEPSFASGQILADVLYTLGRTEECEAVLADLEDDASSDAQRATLARVRVYNRYWHEGDLESAVAVVEEAKRHITDPDDRAELDGLLAVLEVTSGNQRDGVARGEPLVDHPYQRAVIQASLACSLGMPMLGRAEEAMAVADVGVRAYARLGGQLNLYEPSLLVVAQALALSYLGRLDEADDLATTGYDRALADADAAGWAFFSQARGVICLERGLLDEAIRWWSEAAGLFRSVNHDGPQQWALLGLTLAHAYKGEAEAAAAILAEVERIEHPADMQGVSRHRARAWVKVASGRPADARGHLEEGLALAEKGELWPAAAAVLHDLARLGHADDFTVAAGEVQGRGLGEVGDAGLVRLLAEAEGDLDGMAAAVDRLGDAGAHLLAAEGAYALASEHRRRGNAREATSWSRRAASWAEECPGARTPGLAVPDEPVPLTRREREVATLAAGGLASKDIADRLFVSVRTVDNHLGRVYDKLGISSRAELTELLEG
jgi:DNA-binding CsgD family transcriptional regulator